MHMIVDSCRRPSADAGRPALPARGPAVPWSAGVAGLRRAGRWLAALALGAAACGAQAATVPVLIVRAPPPAEATQDGDAPADSPE